MITETCTGLVPFSAVFCCSFHEEAQDISWTRSAAMPFAENPFRLASVGGCAPSDVEAFLAGSASLTGAVRRRIREWASATTSEVERPTYVIPATTKPAKHRQEGHPLPRHGTQPERSSQAAETRYGRPREGGSDSGVSTLHIPIIRGDAEADDAVNRLMAPVRNGERKALSPKERD